MRELDRRTKFSRRVFLRSTAAAVPAAALAASAGISASAAWAQEAKALQPATMATLVRMSRDIFPHDHLADIWYVNAAAPWDQKSAEDAALKSLLEQGVAMLDANAQARHGSPYIQVPWEEQRVVLLQQIEPSAFFQKVRGDLVVSLYNQHDLWIKFGYEGSSAEKGGYLHRGFNDIDWLPQG